MKTSTGSLTLGQINEIKADLSLPADAAAAISALTASADSITDTIDTEIRPSLGVKPGRGIAGLLAFLNAIAWAGGDTTPIVPAGNYNVSTFAEVQTALASATSGQVIRVNDRSAISQTARISLPVGVSIKAGGGVTWTSAFTPAGTTQADQALILLVSTSEGTIGNQTIENIAFSGNAYQASGAIYVKGRSNVKIKNCTAYEFNWNFCTFNGRVVETDGPATIKAVGNGVYGCSSAGCSRWVGSKVAPYGYASGIIQYGSQSGFEIKDCILIAKGRGDTDEGYCTKFYLHGYSDGVLFQNNTLRKSYADGTPNNFIFAAEVWHDTGVVVLDCYVEGRFDLNGVTRGGFRYGAHFSGNVFGTGTLPTVVATGSGIAFELAVNATPCSDILIENNLFKNQWQAIYFYQKANPTGPTARVVFRNNKCLNTRLAEWVAENDAQGGTTGWVVHGNTFRRTGATAINAAVWMPNIGTNTNWTVRRNIIAGFSTAPISAGAQAGSTSGVVIADNVYSGNGTNAPVWATTPGSLTGSNNVTADPLFDAADADGLKSLYADARGERVGADDSAGLARVI